MAVSINKSTANVRCIDIPGRIDSKKYDPRIRERELAESNDIMITE